MPAWACPGQRSVILAGVIVDLVGEVGDQVESLGQVVAPDGMVMQRCWNAREPRQRAKVARHERCKAPVEDGGHVACGSQVASAGRCQHVSEWVLTSLGRNIEQVGPQGRPGGFIGESEDVLVGLVKLCDSLWSDKLFDCDVEAVGVALNRIVESSRRVAELAQQGTGGDGRFISGDDLLERLGRRARGNGVGSDDGVGVAVADDLEVEVVGVPAAGEHGVQLLPGFPSGEQAVHGVSGDALGGVDGGGVAEAGRVADVVGGESDRAVAADVPHGQVSVFRHICDGPAIAVLDPVSGGEAESAVVPAGDDHVSDAGPVSIGQPHLQ